MQYCKSYKFIAHTYKRSTCTHVIDEVFFKNWSLQLRIWRMRITKRHRSRRLRSYATSDDIITSAAIDSPWQPDVCRLFLSARVLHDMDLN